MLAPKPGRETLEDIKGETKRLVEKGKDMMHSCEDEFDDMLDDVLPEPDTIEFDLENE